MKTKTPILRLSALAAAAFIASSLNASAVSTVNIRLEAGALGNIGAGNTNTTINGGGTLQSDIANKLVTSTTTGQGSILTIQTDGKAGPGTVAAPLFVTVTAQSHLDVVDGNIGDFQAGIITMTAGTGAANVYKDLGLGVRVFTVNQTTGLRASGANPAIEGSFEVSGGTDTSTFAQRGNGPPHVDERVNFAFAGSGVLGSSIKVVLTKYDGVGTLTADHLNGSQDIFDLIVHRTVGADIVLNGLNPSTTDTAHGWTAGFLTAIDSANDVWQINFDKLLGLGANDVVTSFSIRANDDDPTHPAGTAEHFLIDGLSASTSTPPPPVPDGGSTIVLLGIALSLLPAAKAFQKRS